MSWSNACRARARGGFTLIELIVVIVLLGVIAGLMAPRLTDQPMRRAERAAKAVRNLVSVAAHRDSLGAGRVALSYESEGGVLSLESMVAAEASAEAAWKVDALVPPVMLDPLVIRDARVGGGTLDAKAWRIEFPTHEPRNVIELSMEFKDAGGRSPARWSVVLLPGASAAELDEGAGVASGERLRAVDLDATGRGAQTW